ncbi:hypothetical protein BGZ70_002859 [Mortierella alpina]|uniref:Uncharacterized protein n=1 Tax=Mortierella alpina TaxID=64518 RepID=A0A9P6IWL1_MORAP|nr:hypothetical protein BGZ70_002859 [Mortierella alpina]
MNPAQYVRVGAIDSQGVVVRAPAVPTYLRVRARTSCYGNGIDESRIAAWLSGRPNGIVKTPSSRIGFLLKNMFDEDSEVSFIKEGSLDLDE